MRALLLVFLPLVLGTAVTIERKQSPTIDALVDFVRAHGGFVHEAVSVQEVDGRGVRGMVALRDLPAHERLFYVPNSVSLTEKTAEKYLPHAFRAAIRYRQCSTFFPSLPMVSFLAAYRRGHLGIFPSRPALPPQEPNGSPQTPANWEYKLFFSAFPQECDMPICLTGNRTETMHALSLISDYSDISFVDFRNQYMQCLDGVHGIMQKPTDVYDYSYVTMDDLLWGFHTVDSRAWSSTDSCGEYTTQASTLCGQMIPYADLINHHQDAPQITTEGYYTDKPIKAGQELFLTYGSKSPWELFKQYGFFLDHHDTDTVNWYPFTVSFHTEPDSPFSAAKASLLEFLLYQSEFTTVGSTSGEGVPTLEVWHKTQLQYGAEFQLQLMAFLRIVHASWEEFSTHCLTPERKSLTGAGNKMFSLANEILVYEDLVSSFDGHINEAWGSETTRGTWVSDMDQVMDVSESSPLTGFPLRRTVIRERAFHKRIVYDARQRATDKLVALRTQRKDSKWKEQYDEMKSHDDL